ncbi:MAG: hypothetical protein ABIQ89_02655 [Candidatus Saccharimonadales bacterium]
MKLTEYHTAVLNFLAQNKYGKRREDKIYQELTVGPLNRQNIKTILRDLEQAGLIVPITIPEQEIQFIAEMSETPVTNVGYRITQLGKDASTSVRSNVTNNTYANISNSAIAHNSPHATQSINIEELSEDLRQKYQELQDAVARKDSSAMKKAFGYIADKSVDVAIAIITRNLLP